MARAALFSEIRRLFAKGVGSATIVAILRCRYSDVNEALRAA